MHRLEIAVGVLGSDDGNESIDAACALELTQRHCVSHDEAIQPLSHWHSQFILDETTKCRNTLHARIVIVKMQHALVGPGGVARWGQRC